MKTITIKKNGWYTINKKVYAEPLEKMPCSQAYIIRNDEGVHLISYTTHVASILNDGKIICYGLYSNTTRRHIGAFASQFNLSFCDFKKAYLNSINKEV